MRVGLIRVVRWVEEALIKHSDFALPRRKAVVKSDLVYGTILVDETKSSIEHPKKNKNSFTLERRKIQLVVDKKSHMIICTAFCNGKRHDFRLFKESKTEIYPGIDVLVVSRD